MTPFECAEVLADRAMPSFPLAANKAPLTPRGFHDATICHDPAAWSGAALVGIPTGAAGGFDVLDIDMNGGMEWLAANAHRLPKTRTVHTRSGGRHLCFKPRPDLRCSAGKVAPSVDVRAEGGFVVAWDMAGLAVEHADHLADWPEWLAAVAAGPRARHAGNPARSAADLAPPSVQSVVDLLNRMPNPDDATRDDYLRVMMAAKGCIDGLDGDGAEEISAAAIEWADRWSGSPGYDVEAEKWESDFSTRDAPLAGWRNLLVAAKRLGVDTSPELEAQANREFPGVPATVAAPADSEVGELLGNPNWQSKLLMNEKGTPRALLANALTALREAPAWTGVIGYDDFRQRIVMTGPPPWCEGAFNRRPITDADVTYATEWLQSHDIAVNSGQTGEAIAAIAQGNKCHPAREYMESVRGRGTGRLDRWLVEFLGAPDTPLNRAFGAKFMISAAARVIKPGCKVDTMLVLEGRQGLKKSTALRALCADPEWFADHMPDLANKDALLQLQGRLIIEHAEMATLNRADANRVKEFLSRQIDLFRPPFGKTTADFPRQCVFAATVNPGGSGYLKDETGARRFWPVACGVGWAATRVIDAAALADARDELFGEAVDRLLAGEPWWLEDSALIAAQQNVSDSRFEADAWHDIIAGAVAGKPWVHMSELFGRLGIQTRDQDKIAQKRIAGVLAHLGWTPSRKYIDGVQTRVHLPPDTA